MKPYKYDIGDRVHMSYERTERDGTVIALLPSGGGARGKDPLYLIRFDVAIPLSTEGFGDLTGDRRNAEIHSQFLSLISKHLYEDDVVLDTTSLL